MHRRAVTCELCGKAFFPKSMKFHIKACRKKQANLLVPCHYCDCEFRSFEMEQHVKNCPKAKRQLKREPLCRQATQHQRRHEEPHQRSAADFSNSNESSARIPCAVCGRMFSRDRISIHQRICRKSKAGKKKRGVFDSTKQRLQGTDMGIQLKFHRKGERNGRKYRGRSRQKDKRGPDGSHRISNGNKKKSSWKTKSSALRDTIRNARMYTRIEKTGGDISMLPPAAPAPDPADFVPCPHCGRTFNENAAARHIPKCQHIIAKPRRLMRGRGRSNSSTRKLHGTASSAPSTFGNGRASLSYHAVSLNHTSADHTRSRFATNKNMQSDSGSGGPIMTNATSLNNPLLSSHFQSQARRF